MERVSFMLLKKQLEIRVGGLENSFETQCFFGKYSQYLSTFQVVIL